jgi:WD40 repeat protein
MASPISPDGRYMATTGTDAIVRLWDMNTEDGIPQEIRQMTGHTVLAMSPVFSPMARGWRLLPTTTLSGCGMS